MKPTQIGEPEVVETWKGYRIIIRDGKRIKIAAPNPNAINEIRKI